MVHSLEAVLFAIAAGPVLLVLVRPSFRRAFPYFAAMLALALVGGAGAAVVLVVFAPVWLVHAAAAATVALIVLALWRARGAHGAREQLPAGRQPPLSVRPWLDADFFLKASRRYGPVFKTRQFLRPMVCIVGLPSGRALLRDHDADLDAPPMAFDRLVEGGYINFRDRSDHDDVKTVFGTAFSRPSVDACVPMLRNGMHHGLAAAARRSAAGVDPRAEIDQLLLPLWIELFFGLRPETPESDRLRELCDVLDIRKPVAMRERRLRGATAEANALIRRQLELLDASPRQADEHSFLAAIHRQRREMLDSPAITVNLLFILISSWADVCGLLTWLVRMLADHPVWMTRLREETTGDADAWHDPSSVAARVVAETLRLEQSEHIYRRATADIQCSGHVIPRGWLIRLCIHESHRDPTIFEAPDRFDPDRFLHRDFSPDEYTPFGAYRLACPGQYLTRTIAALFVMELAEYDLRVVRDAPRQLSSWLHWAPGARFRVALDPAA